MRNVAFGCFSRGNYESLADVKHEKRRLWPFLSGSHESLADVKPMKNVAFSRFCWETQESLAGIEP